MAEYQSNVLEWPGQADRFRFPESRTWHGGIEVDPKDQYLNPKSLADSGHNPPQIIVDECRRRGMRAFVSLRMNDIHDGQHPRGALPNPELPTFKRLNPDWLVPDLDWWSALNFEVAPVRELKLRVIEEFFDRWDFDGIELDWLRHTFYFPRGLEREKGKYLTEFMRAVRRSLRQRAAERGRPIEIAVRVPERVEWCLEGGFEVPTWIREGLVDFLILGQGLTECRGLSGFRELMGSRRLPIYPSLYPFGNGYPIYPDEVIRGSAANLWRDGADGLYTFNWFFYGNWRSRLLREIADPGPASQQGQALHPGAAFRGPPYGTLPPFRFGALQHHGQGGPASLHPGQGGSGPNGHPAHRRRGLLDSPTHPGWPSCWWAWTDCPAMFWSFRSMTGCLEPEGNWTR